MLFRTDGINVGCNKSAIVVKFRSAIIVTFKLVVVAVSVNKSAIVIISAAVGNKSDAATDIALADVADKSVIVIVVISIAVGNKSDAVTDIALADVVVNKSFVVVVVTIRCRTRIVNENQYIELLFFKI